ncbi:MAG: S-methyl-5-thioribose-1-phosphate isomerase, partial [Alphaproteobacteria bacterium]
MLVNGQAYRSIWREDETVFIIDQTVLPHEFRIVELTGLTDTADAIRTMQVRGAPLIGATAAYGMALAMRQNADDAYLAEAEKTLAATRPTAINLRWALARMTGRLAPLSPDQRPKAAILEADRICDEDVAINESIGRHGLEIIKAVAKTKPPGATI